ncbi:MAG: MATE family efflux transporter [Roseburia sp.]|nr:MATE family efflux transporter [Roseburia sp.]MCM1241844.1 MATE family efflux transporter [Roseburia sp.]
MKDINKLTLDMTRGKPSALLLRFSLPLVAGNLFQQFYTFADTLIVGQKLGVHALAALGATEWLSFLMFGFIQGLTQGFSINVSKYFGEENEELVQQNIFHALIASVGAAILFTLFGQVMIVPLLKLLHTPGELLGMAALYIRILYLGIPVCVAYNMTAALLRAFGNSRAPLTAMTIASFSNIALDLLFVMVFEMGIEGAACATLLAQAFAAIYCILALCRIEQAKVKLGNTKWSFRIVSEQMKLGVPMGFQNVITAAGGLVVQSVVNGFGILFLAGYTAANKLYGLLEIAASSYGYAISTYTAQNAGAGQKERIRTGLIAALKMGAVTAYLMSFIMLVFGKPILGLFIVDVQVEAAEAIWIGYRFLCILAVFFPLLYIVYIIRSCIQGMGNSIMPMLSSLMQVLMRILCALVLTKIIGSTGVFWGEVMAWLFADIFFLYAFLRQYRRFFQL